MNDWFLRLLKFIAEINKRTSFGFAEVEYLPPISLKELESFTVGLKYPLPLPLVDFFTTVSAGTSIDYQLFESGIYGSVSFFGPDEMENVFEKLELYGNSISKDDPDGAGAQWLNSFPILHVPNGDVIAFDMTTKSEDPPILFLSHEGEFFQPIAKNLSSFLSEWENLFYVDPGFWNLDEEYLDSKTGYLNSQLPATKQLRELISEIK